MEKQILDLKKLFDSEIKKELFFKLLLHVTDGYDGYKEPIRGYANYLDIENWEKLFTKPNKKIIITHAQLIIFFEYMTKYHLNFFGKNQEKYYVHREFMNNQLRTEENFKFEAIVLTTIDILYLSE